MILFWWPDLSATNWSLRANNNVLKCVDCRNFGSYIWILTLQIATSGSGDPDWSAGRPKTSRWSCFYNYSRILKRGSSSGPNLNLIFQLIHPPDLSAQPEELLAWLYAPVMITVNSPSVLTAEEFPFINTDTSWSAQTSSPLFYFGGAILITPMPLM